MKESLPLAELVKIASSLEDYHRVFYTFWSMSNVYFTDEIKTAAVKFVPDSKPELLLNKAFWEAKSFVTKQFIIVHECLHVILDHFKRNAAGVKGATPRNVNIAQDITINEMGVDVFGFDRRQIDGWEKLCWIDTVFKTPKAVKRNMTFIYYLMLLINEQEDGSELSSGVETLDEHLDQPEDQAQSQAASRMASKLASELEPGILEDLINAGKAPDVSVGAGVGDGIFDHIFVKTAPQPLNFSKIVTGLKKTRLRSHDKNVDTFRTESRRFSSVMDDNPSLILPGHGVIEKKKKDRLFIAVFMDVSGSCIGYLNNFWRVAQAFSEEPDMFEVELYLYDTSVQCITGTKPPVKVGGGTAYDIIERELQTKFKVKHGCYPDAIINITDGDGNPVKPEHPKRWVWLLTYNNKKYVHAASRAFLLKDVTFK